MSEFEENIRTFIREEVEGFFNERFGEFKTQLAQVATFCASMQNKQSEFMGYEDIHKEFGTSVKKLIEWKKKGLLVCEFNNGKGKNFFKRENVLDCLKQHNNPKLPKPPRPKFLD